MSPAPAVEANIFVLRPAWLALLHPRCLHRHPLASESLSVHLINRILCVTIIFKFLMGVSLASSYNKAKPSLYLDIPNRSEAGEAFLDVAHLHAGRDRGQVHLGIFVASH